MVVDFTRPQRPVIVHFTLAYRLTLLFEKKITSSKLLAIIFEIIFLFNTRNVEDNHQNEGNFQKHFYPRVTKDKEMARIRNLETKELTFCTSLRGYSKMKKKSTLSVHLQLVVNLGEINDNKTFLRE